MTTIRSIAASVMMSFLGACGTNFTACPAGHSCNSTFSQTTVWGASGSAASAPISKEQLPVVSSPAWVSPDTKPPKAASSEGTTLGLPSGTVVNGESAKKELSPGTVVNEGKADLLEAPTKSKAAPKKPDSPKTSKEKRLSGAAPPAKPAASASAEPSPPPLVTQEAAASVKKPTCLLPASECPSWTSVPAK